MKNETLDFARDFFGCRPKEEKPKTTDRPNIKMFMYQLLNQYHNVSSIDAITWQRVFAMRKTGKHYRITITMEEING